MDQVSVYRVDHYDAALCRAAVDAHFERMGVDQELSPDTRVLLKVNLLTARAPEGCATSHPALVRAVAQWLCDHGVKHVVLCDSPGGLYNEAVLRKTYAVCGMEALEKEGLLKLNYDCSFGEKNGFQLLTPVLEADYMIDCCKLKTHGLAVMTAGVKNVFGCIPGLKKPEWHAKRPNADVFSEMILDLCQTVSPRLTLCDAIECMEGNGPGGGTPRHMGYTLCARSPYALDREAAILMGYQPLFPPINRHAFARGLVTDQVDIIGDEIVPASPPFTLPDAVAGKERFFTPGGILHHFLGKRKAFPTVNEGKCVGCGRCAESCPEKLIHIENGKAHMRREGCISCFCCQEMCPAHAIEAVQGRQKTLRR